MIIANIFIGLSIPTGLSIILIVLIFIFAKNKKTKNSTNSSPNTPNEKNVSQKKKSGGFLTFLSDIVSLAIIILLMIVLYFICVGTYHTFYKANYSNQNSTVTSPKIPVGARVLRTSPEGIFTPCSPTFDYAAEVETDGDPVYFQFPGIKDPIYFSGKGRFDMKQAEGRSTGPVSITSAIKNHQARIRIYEVI